MYLVYIDKSQSPPLHITHHSLSRSRIDIPITSESHQIFVSSVIHRYLRYICKSRSPPSGSCLYVSLFLYIEKIYIWCIYLISDMKLLLGEHNILISNYRDN